jgi:hypothetical protein
MMAEFQVIYGRKDQPKENWSVHTAWDYSGHAVTATTIWGNPQEANEICKRLNSDFKLCGENLAAMLKRLPDRVDYLAREATREDYQPFEVQGEVHHCAELRTDGTVSYYNTIYDAYDNRRMSMKVGRYLRKFTDKTDNQISDICARYGFEFGDSQVLFAKTREEIRHVYEHGPRSCMSGEAIDYGAHIHPAEAYASGDFEVAYLKRDERITARAVTIPSKKLWIGIYGDRERMKPALDELGYHQIEDDEAAIGLHLLCLHGYNDNIAVPYFDFFGGVRFNDDKTKLVITRHGAVAGEDGYLLSDLSTPCSDDEDDYEWDY